MPTSVDIQNLKINKLTEAQYDTAVSGGVIGENELSMITDASLSTVVSVSGTSVTQELSTDIIYDCGELSALTVTFPVSTDAGYVAQINFSSGATATTLTAPVDVIWRGSDVDSNGFTPVANKRYAILFFSDGVNIRGLVQGA